MTSYIRHTVSYQSDASGEMQNVFHWAVNPDLPVVADLAETSDIAMLMNYLYGTILVQWADNCQVISHKSELWDDVTQAFDLYTEASVSGLVGSQVAHAVSGGVAAVLAVPIVGGGRSARKFIGGFSEAGIADGSWNSFVISALAQFGINWVLGYVAPMTYTFAPRIYRHATKEFAELTPTVNIDTLAGYQRRRKPGVGI